MIGMAWYLESVILLIFGYLTWTAFSQRLVCLGHCNSTCTTCTQNQTYQCGDGNCISLSKYKNGVIDCKDSSDEDINCCDGYFKCDTMAHGLGKCLSNSFVDDGVVQCIDGSDESATNDKTCAILTTEATEISLPIRNYVYYCHTHKYGSKRPKCIKLDWIMDGKFDCPQADDEDPTLFDRCKLGKPACGANANCFSGTNGTVVCICKAGFTGDGKSNCTSANGR